MARRPVLGGGTLNPFGGGNTDFGAFNIVDPGNEAYLAFLKVETAWNAGKATNDDYLAALKAYAAAQTPGTSDAISIQARYDEAVYTVGRNVLLAKVENQTADVADLVAYDKKSLDGLTQDSQEYQQRLDAYRSSQNQLISDAEKKQVDAYQAGKISTTALRQWYQDQLTSGVIDNNPDLVDSIKGQIDTLTQRVQDEKDQQVLQNYQNGKMTSADFIAYATAAKARYGADTTQAKDWTDRLTQARQNASETNLVYRYNLSQQYAQLEQFVKSSKAPGSGTSTSHSTRVVLGADGKWHTVTSTKTTSHAPSQSEVAAYRQHLVEVNDAKRQMQEIASKLGGVGGFVTSQTMKSYYTKQLGTFAKGSDEWYAVQGKIDSINQQIHSDAVLSQQGIHITYPKTSSSPAPGTTKSGSSGGTVKAASTASSGQMGGGYSLQQFMRAIATQESGGRYTARNASTGAYGKYQILPSNWSAWAQKAGLSANAPQTPENQEKVATAAFKRLASAYHNDWSRVAAAWFAGVAGSKDPNNWGPRTVRYVNAIMSHMGTTVAAVRGGGGSAGAPTAGSYTGGVSIAGSAPRPSSTTKATAVHPAGAKTATGSGPLAEITSVSVAGRRGTTQVVGEHYTGFPTGLDSAAFSHFYANYEAAFENGEESFIDNSTGKQVAYFIGSDPAERINRMRQLDDLRIQMYDERAKAYAGTPSELTANNERNNAVKDVARHEYQIVDTGTGQNASSKINMQTDPLAAGIRLLDKTKATIQSNIDMAMAAYKRGDLTTAYTLFQEAQHLSAANGQTLALLSDYAAVANAKVQQIQQATGVSVDQALGGKGTTFQNDLDRLTHADTDLTSLFTGDPSKTLTELKSHLQLDSAGNAQFEDPSDPGSALKLTDDTYFFVDDSGNISVKSVPPTKNVATGQNEYNDGKTVTIRIKSGTHVIQAQAQWRSAQVGAFVDPNDPSHLLPIMGKIVQQKVDGKWVTFYENPLAPGTQNGWSDHQWIYTAPKGFTTKTDAQGNTTYSFTPDSGAPNPHMQGQNPQQATYTMVYDQTTGTYVMTYSTPGGLFSAAVPEGTPAPWSMSDAQAAALFAAAGTVRSGSTGGVFDSTDLPVFGMNADDYQKWLKQYQPSALAAANKVEQPKVGNVTPHIFAPYSGTDSYVAPYKPQPGNATPHIYAPYPGTPGYVAPYSPKVGNATPMDLGAGYAAQQDPTQRAGLPPIAPPATSNTVSRAPLPGKNADDTSWAAAQRQKSTPKPVRGPTTAAAAAAAAKSSKPARRPLPKIVAPKVTPKKKPATISPSAVHRTAL